MTANTQPPADKISAVKQIGFHWPANAHRVTQTDSDGNEITNSNPLPVDVRTIQGIVSTVNSTSTPLPGDTGGSDHIFTGVAELTNGFGIIYINVYSDAASATDGLMIEQSSNGTDWDHDDVFTVPATTGKNFSINPFARYYRVVYTNGVAAQTDFRLQSTLKVIGVPSSHRISDSIIDDDDAELVKSVLTGKDTNNVFQNVNITVDGDLKISDNSSGLAIAKGDVTGTSFIHKFGQAPDFDVGDGFVTVWDGAEDNTTWEHMVYTYSSTADIQYISSNDAGDTVDIEVQGLDANYGIVTQTKTLTGQTSATLDTPLIRVFRMKNVNSVDLVGHVFCSTTTAPAGGVPTAANIRAIIQPGNNQTLMGLYTVPAGKTGYMRDWYASTAGAKRDSQHTIKLRARPLGGVFQLKHISNIAVVGSSHIQHNYAEPEIFEEKTDVEMSCDTDQDIAGVSAGFDIVLVDN